MEFLNPGIGWGLLAVSVPLILHFWHQKRGKELPWAAQRWLAGAVLQSSRGIRLENILLLILRCLLLALLVLYLSEPLFKGGRPEKVHWIQPDREVVENFRFELEEAAKKGEKRFWFNGDPVEQLSSLPEYTDLQLGINKVKARGEAEIYLSDAGNFTRFTKVYVPASYTLHTVKSRLQEKADAQGEATLFTGDKALKVLLESEKESVLAALKAITEVYGLSFEIDEKRTPGQRYDLAFTHRPDSLAAVNIVSRAAALPAGRMTGYGTTVWLEELLKPETSEVVFNGALPEVILEALMADKNIARGVLSERQLRNKFAVRQANSAEGSFSSVILVLLVLVLGAERWLAIHKNS